MTSEFQNTIDEVRAALHVLEQLLLKLKEHVNELEKKNDRPQEH